jgi:hypothetical protein
VKNITTDNIAADSPNGNNPGFWGPGFFSQFSAWNFPGGSSSRNTNIVAANPNR